MTGFLLSHGAAFLAAFGALGPVPAHVDGAAPGEVVAVPASLIDRGGRELPERITSVMEARKMVRRLETPDRPCAGPTLACMARW
jgi:hypothetical protein